MTTTELKKKLSEIEFHNLPRGEALAKTRATAMDLITQALKKKGKWDAVRSDPPGKFVTISEDPNNPGSIMIYISEHLSKLLKD